MIKYPKMLSVKDKTIRNGMKVRVYDKIDGSNIRWQWNHKRGWWQQGTRNEYFDATDPLWGHVYPLFMKGMADDILKRFRPKKTMMLFTELYGPGSFAGSHPEVMRPKQKLFVIDLFADQNWLLPEELEVFDDIGAKHIADVEYNEEWVEDVRDGYYNVREGVVVKSMRKRGLRAKIKTYAYLKQIQKLYGKKWQDHWE